MRPVRAIPLLVIGLLGGLLVLVLSRCQAPATPEPPFRVQVDDVPVWPLPTAPLAPSEQRPPVQAARIEELRQAFTTAITGVATDCGANVHAARCVGHVCVELVETPQTYWNVLRERPGFVLAALTQLAGLSPNLTSCGKAAVDERAFRSDPTFIHGSVSTGWNGRYIACLVHALEEPAAADVISRCSEAADEVFGLPGLFEGARPRFYRPSPGPTPTDPDPR